jgi:hypothetical protein
MAAPTAKQTTNIQTKRNARVISDFRHDAAVISAILGYEASSKVKKS